MVLKLGLAGHPVAHSLSPQIHQSWITAEGLEGRYDLFDIAPDDFAAAMNDLFAVQKMDGLNVTVPHKRRAYKFSDLLSDEAKAMGAVNTLQRLPDGRIYGHNTDCDGFWLGLREESAAAQEGFQNALIIGAGGAARAVAFALLKYGTKNATITNRTFENARNVAESLGFKAVVWEDRNKDLSQRDLIVQTTSLGLPGSQSPEIDWENVSPAATVCDIIYKPRMTGFMTAAQKAGCDVVGGLGMLLYQAQQSFSLWTGRTPQVTADLRERLEWELNPDLKKGDNP